MSPVSQIFHTVEKVSIGLKSNYYSILSDWKRLFVKWGQASKNDEKLPYLHRVTKRWFLVINKKMGLCLYVFLLNLTKTSIADVNKRIKAT